MSRSIHDPRAQSSAVGPLVNHRNRSTRQKVRAMLYHMRWDNEWLTRKARRSARWDLS